MPDSNRHYYACPIKLDEISDIEQLESLDRAVKNARERLAYFKRLSTLGILETERLFYTNQEIADGITRWQTTLDNMVMCWNDCLSKMMIK